MTRYTRGTKSTTHQRGNPGAATPWADFQAEHKAHAAKRDTSEQRSQDSGKDVAASSSGGPKLVKLFGQFWVPQPEAKRLQKLIVKLKGEGLSRKAISESLRNEIRRAEKKAKRSKDKTCFNCRQFGHLLADCPSKPVEVANSVDSTLIRGMDSLEFCFKCGSLEHTSRKCIKNKDNENYKFAKCFICQKTGHISKQCPDNQHGIFPTGGTCNDCGDPGHLAKDCPKAVKPGDDLGAQATSSKESGGVTVSAVLDPKMSTEYEAVDEDWQTKIQQSLSSKKVKGAAEKRNAGSSAQANTAEAKKRRVKF